MLSDKEQLKNLEREFIKIMMMLQERYPEAWEYYTDRLRPINEVDDLLTEKN